MGHAVHHDLRALRLDYQPVIDTSMLLAYRYGWLVASERAPTNMSMLLCLLAYWTAAKACIGVCSRKLALHAHLSAC